MKLKKFTGQEARLQETFLQQARKNPADGWQKLSARLPESARPAVFHAKRRRRIGIAFAALFLCCAVAAGGVLSLPYTTQSLNIASGSTSDSGPQTSVALSSLRFGGGKAGTDALFSPNRNSGSTAADIVAFDESFLADTQLAVLATVLQAQPKDYRYDTCEGEGVSSRTLHHTQSSVVYTLRIDQVVYARKDFAQTISQGQTLLVEIDCFDGCVLAKEPPYPLQNGVQYLLPLVRQEKSIGLLPGETLASGDIARLGDFTPIYPFQPFITVTQDGAFVFPAGKDADSRGYHSLAIEEAVPVTMENPHVLPFSCQLYLRKDRAFLSDFKGLILREKGK